MLSEVSKAKDVHFFLDMVGDTCVSETLTFDISASRSALEYEARKHFGMESSAPPVRRMGEGNLQYMNDSSEDITGLWCWIIIIKGKRILCPLKDNERMKEVPAGTQRIERPSKMLQPGFQVKQRAGLSRAGRVTPVII